MCALFFWEKGLALLVTLSHEAQYMYWDQTGLLQLTLCDIDILFRIMHALCTGLNAVFSKPGQSQGLLYKKPCHWLVKSVSHPFPPIALRHRYAQTIRENSSSYKIDYFIVIQKCLNPERHHNPISGSKVTAIILKGLILLIGGVASRRVCACSLHRRLVSVSVISI